MKALSSEQLAFVSGLFVRVGMWISHADDTDRSDKSENKEKDYMLRALTRVGKMSKSESVRQSANMALTVSDVPQDRTEESLAYDIHRAIEIFMTVEDTEALPQFRKALIYVATSVARAYREELDQHEDEFLLETFMNKIAGYLNKDADPEEFKNINISPAEDSALTMISEALRV